MRTLQDKLNDLGISTLRIDMLGHGDSEGAYSDLTLTEAIEDVLIYNEYVRKMGYFYVGFIGQSFGAVAGIMACPVAHFDFLVLISPPTHYDIKEIIISGYYLLKGLRRYRREVLDNRKDSSVQMKFFQDYASHDSYVAAAKIDSPVFIIQGGGDKIVPLAKT